MASDNHQDGGGQAVSTHRLEHDFSVVLARTIKAVQHDPAQFRNLIYEMARVQLQREAWRHSSQMNLLQLGRMMLALETAIERVETHAAQHDSIPASAPSGLAAAPDGASAPDSVVVFDQPLERARPGMRAAMAHGLMMMRAPAPLRAIVRLGVLALLAATAAIVLYRELSPVPPAVVEHVAAQAPMAPAAQAIAALRQQPATPSPASSGALPSVYGVYAVSRGRLYALEPLAGHVPDLRVFMSWIIKTPSHTLLPDGDLSFIVYRRDIALTAPDRVMVRVIAKVAHSMTFKAGQAVTTNVDGEWAIRNVSFDYRVAPSSESPEMILVKPENAAPSIPAGRYALIIKGQMFDFTVDGAITQTAQCLERTEATNGTFYSECRQLR